MEITLTNNATVDQLIAFDFRNYPEEPDFGTILHQLTNIIDEQVVLLQDLFNKTRADKLTFSLEQVSENDENTLACFLPELSTKNELRFSIYYPSIVGLCLDQLDKTDTNTINVKNTIIHELIHALDQEILARDIDLNKQNNIQVYETQYNSLINTNSKISKELLNVQQVFFSFLRIFRNEGIAILGQKILGNNIQKSFTREDAFTCYRIDLNHIFQIGENLCFFNSGITDNILAEIKSIGLHAYFYADIILLYALKNRISDFINVEELHEKLLTNQNIEFISKKDKIKLVEKMIAFDHSDYIQEVLRLKNYDNEYIVDQNAFYSYCGIMQSDQDEENITAFLNGILYAGLNNDPHKYLETLKTLLGYPMEIEEIERLFAEFKQEKHYQDIVEEIIKLAEILLVELKTNKSEIAKWALTYFLDEEDLIHDDIPYVGFQDDWIVMNAAYSLL